jgi:hypothetical protein
MLSSGFEGMQSISYIKIFIVIVPEGEMTANFIIKKKSMKDMAIPQINIVVSSFCKFTFFSRWLMNKMDTSSGIKS